METLHSCPFDGAVDCVPHFPLLVTEHKAGKNYRLHMFLITGMFSSRQRDKKKGLLEASTIHYHVRNWCLIENTRSKLVVVDIFDVVFFLLLIILV